MRLKRVLIVILLLLPISAWAFVKPVRLLLPQQNGVTCIESVCVDNIARIREATVLYEAGLVYVHDKLTMLENRPLMIFCSTATCYKSFGGGKERAITYPNLGTLIAPDSWAPHFVRHEFIHALQAQELGPVQMMLAPAWFREGMAYSVSDPPSYDMPPQFESYRSEYESWAIGIPTSELWASAKEL